MGPSRKNAAKLANLQKGRNASKDGNSDTKDTDLQLSDAQARIVELEAALSAEQVRNSAFKTALALAKDELALCTENHVAIAHFEELKAALSTERCRNADLEKALARAKNKIGILTENLAASQESTQKWYSELRNERKSRKRAYDAKMALEQKFDILQQAQTKSKESEKKLTANASHVVESLMHAEKENSALETELSSFMERSKLELEVARKDLSDTRNKLRRVQACLSRVQSKHANDTGPMRAKIKFMAKALKEKSTFSLLEKGVYTQEARNLFRLLVKCGCAKEYIDQVIQSVLKCAGVQTLGRVSRRTVSRVLVEGYIASQIQLGYEMSQNEGMYLYISYICLNFEQHFHSNDIQCRWYRPP